MQAIKKQSRISLITIILTFLVISLSFNNSMAQVLGVLKVNDTIPDIAIANLIRERPEPLKTKKLYKDGLLIINFWATWCVPCVKEMTFLAGEVEKYKGRLHVINIGYEPKSVILAFLKAHPELANSGLEVNTDDKLWIKMFYHQALPHNVWINSDGIIKSITGGDEITDENIGRILNDQTTKMFQKVEVPFNMFSAMHIPDSLIEYRSIFDKYLPGVTMSGNVIDSHGWGKPYMKRFFEFNSLITGLFWDAYQMVGDYNYVNVHDFIEIQTADSSKYFWPGADPKTGEHFKVYHGISQDEWDRANDYSYELRTPKVLVDSIFFDKVISELEFNLKVKTWQELRKRNCIIVTIKSQRKQFEVANLSNQQSVIVNGNKIVITNAPMSVFLRWLSEHLRTEFSNALIPYIDQTGLNGLVSFTVDMGGPLESKSRADIERCMSEQLGFEFKKKEQLYPILIIKDL